MKAYTSHLVLCVATFLLACGGNPPPDTTGAAGMETDTAQPADTEGLSDERAKELAREYIELAYDGDYEQLWQHVTPEAKQRIGSLDQFRSSGEDVMNRLGTEVSTISETVEPASAGMLAHKMYERISYYSAVEGRRVRFAVGLMNDGSIAGMQVRPVE